MRIKALHPNFLIPTKGTDGAGAYDLYMPEAGFSHELVGLGFSAEVPKGYAALILPRSSAGVKLGVELKNTCGVIDSDYRGEWKAAIQTKSEDVIHWNAGDRLLQFLIVPVADVTLELVDELDSTERGSGGFGSSGK